MYIYRLLHKICRIFSNQGQNCIIGFKMHQDIYLQVTIIIVMYNTIILLQIQ